MHGTAKRTNSSRNNYLDARNFANPTNTTTASGLVPNPQAQFIRNQFGGDGGGAIKKDKMFVYLSYEGLRQRQAVPLRDYSDRRAGRAGAGHQ